jgi:hypothetical protein
MPKVEIDYSNTIFYKIFCKDPAIKDLYVGLTTNFVQRKHAHKQSCKNEKAMNHNCKLYNAIRNAGGWDNWHMEIIAFHNCADSYEARKKEQEYFEALGATLNSIDPFPKPKIKEPPAKFVKEKNFLFCEPCNIQFSHWTTQETHNNTKKHYKMVAAHMPNTVESNKIVKNTKFQCYNCDYNTSRKSSYIKHIHTAKHKQLTAVASGLTVSGENVANCCKFICQMCNKEYNSRVGLWKHKQKCNPNENSHGEIVDKIKPQDELTEVVKYLMKEILEMKTIMMEVIKTGIHTTNLHTMASPL